MKQLNWMSLWDELQDKIQAKNSWGKNEIITLMNDLEKKMVRQLEKELNGVKDTTQHNGF